MPKSDSHDVTQPQQLLSGKTLHFEVDLTDDGGYVVKVDQEVADPTPFTDGNEPELDSKVLVCENLRELAEAFLEAFPAMETEPAEDPDDIEDPPWESG